MMLTDGSMWERLFLTEYFNGRSHDKSIPPPLTAVYSVNFRISDQMDQYAPHGWTYQLLFKPDEYNQQNHISGLRLIFNNMDDFLLAKLTAGDLPAALINGGV